MSIGELEWNTEGMGKQAGDLIWSLNASGVMRVVPPAGLDYWQRTYYAPLLVKNNGPFCSTRRPGDTQLTIEAQVTIERADGGAQFDQGGLMMYFDEFHWIKTGIEVVDNIPRLSCVVTNEGYSDWSTQIFGSLSLEIRVSQKGDGSYIVEALLDGKWQFIRICHLRKAAEGSVSLGLFACCPVGQTGATVVSFSKWKLSDGVNFKHDAN